MTDPIIKIFDIENTENIFKGWRCGMQYVGHKQILQERAIICASWKTLGDEYVYHTPVCKFGKPRGAMPPAIDDREVVASLIDGLSDADILIAHNGRRHDVGITQARAIYHGMDPLRPITMLDTLAKAKKYFNFNSNALDALAKYLGVGGKTKTDYELWDRCLFGDKKALATMLAYNIDDVFLLEKVYLKMRPFILDHPNLGVLKGTMDTCPNCGAEGSLSRNGTRAVGRASVKQRYHCSVCGTWPSGPTVRARDDKGNTINVR